MADTGRVWSGNQTVTQVTLTIPRADNSGHLHKCLTGLIGVRNVATRQRFSNLLGSKKTIRRCLWLRQPV